MRWLDLDNPEELKRQLEGRIKVNPDDASAYYELGTVYESFGDWSTAKELCNKAISLDLNNVTYHAFRSFVNSCLEEHEEAIADLVTIIELGGDESDYYVDMAQGTQRGMDREYALLTAVSLRAEGKYKIADKLEEWLIKPLR